MSLTEFLLARIAEDEARARAATQSEKWWHWPESDPGPRLNPHQPPMAYVRAHEDPHIGRSMEWADAVHIASWDPARVLAECEAKRRIVEACEAGCECHASGTTLGQTDWDRTILRAMALPYANHPDYDEAWRL